MVFYSTRTPAGTPEHVQLEELSVAPGGTYEWFGHGFVNHRRGFRINPDRGLAVRIWSAVAEKLNVKKAALVSAYVCIVLVAILFAPRIGVRVLFSTVSLRQRYRNSSKMRSSKKKVGAYPSVLNSLQNLLS
jgi:hypothetical protein